MCLYDIFFTGDITITKLKDTITNSNQNSIPDVLPKVIILVVKAVIYNIIAIAFDVLGLDCIHLPKVNSLFSIAFFDVLYKK